VVNTSVTSGPQLQDIARKVLALDHWPPLDEEKSSLARLNIGALKRLMLRTVDLHPSLTQEDEAELKIDEIMKALNLDAPTLAGNREGMGAGVTPAEGSVKPTAGFTFNKVI
jgi:hypothetical protein